MIAAISELWLRKYSHFEKSDDVETYTRHKKALYGFYTDYCNTICDARVLKLICEVKSILGEPWSELKECKLR